jgi:hypothetical protein
MTLAEGDTVPLGWFLKDWDSEVPVLVIEAATVVGVTTDRPNPVTGVREIFRTLSVQKSVQKSVAVPVVAMPPQATSAMKEIIAAGGTAEFTPAVVHARGSHCRQWSVSGEINGLVIRFEAFSTGPHRWICVGGSRPTMAETLALMPDHIIAQAEVEAKSEAHKAYVAALGAAAPTDTSHWTSADYADHDAAQSRNARDW